MFQLGALLSALWSVEAQIWRVWLVLSERVRLGAGESFTAFLFAASKSPEGEEDFGRPTRNKLRYAECVCCRDRADEKDGVEKYDAECSEALVCGRNSLNEIDDECLMRSSHGSSNFIYVRTSTMARCSRMTDEIDLHEYNDALGAVLWLSIPDVVMCALRGSTTMERPRVCTDSCRRFDWPRP
jgi:hypothetical protein